MAVAPEAGQVVRDPKAFGPALAAYARDAAPFRDHLIRTGFKLRLVLFGQSPIPEVLLGREGWLYFTQESALDDYLKAIPLDANGIATMVRIQTERKNWLTARGIAYVVVLSPDKATIYPEYMPPGIVPLGTVSRLDQIIGPLRQAGVDVLDLREPLARAKAEHPAYFKTDTHWNSWGAFRAAAALVAAVDGRGARLAPWPTTATP